MTRTVIVGPGGVGTFFAGHLAAAGHDILACSRRPFDRYIVESERRPAEAPARVVTDVADVPPEYRPVDVCLIGVKAHQTAAAADWIDAVCGPETIVVVIQNGIEGKERLTPLVNGARVLPAVVYCGSDLVTPGHTRHVSHGTLIVADCAEAHTVAELFAGTGGEIVIDTAYHDAAWRKLGLNIVMNGITALTGEPARVLKRPAMTAFATELLSETWALAAADGANLGPADVEAFISSIPKLADEATTSMLVDRQLGRHLEHDAIHGAALRAGQRHGIPTPLVGAMYALLDALDATLS